MADLEVVTDATAVRMGADLAPAATHMEQSLAGVKLAAAGTADATGGLVSGALSAAEAFVTWHPTGYSVVGMLQDVVAEEVKASAGAVKLARDTRDLTSALGPYITEEERAAVGAEALATAEAKAATEAKDAADAARQLATAQAATAKAATAEAATIATASEAMKTHGIVMSDTTARIDGVRDSHGNLTIAWDEGARTAEEKAEAYAKAYDKVAEAMRNVQAIGGEASAALAGFANLAIQGAEREAAAKKKAAKNIGKTIKGLEKMRETATGADLERIQDRIDARKDEQKNMRKLAKRGRKRALKAWKAAQAAQISATVINSAAAMVAFLAPPPMGLGPVAGAIAAAIAAGGMAASIATIATQKPPKFHQGGIVAPPRQEVGAMLETGEGVIRREAMMQPGAAATVERMNAGGTTAGQPMAVYLNDRLVDVLVARAERTDAQSRRGLAMVGTRTMYDRRR
jgi:hypothetical protein